MDLFRVYLLHPTSYEPFAASDAGAPYIQAMLRFIAEPQNPKALIMLAIRGLSNLFKNQSSQHVALLNRQRLVDGVSPHLSHGDKNVRQAAITLVLNYSVLFVTKDDDEGRVQAISALSTCAADESDLQNCLRIAFALGNLWHENQNAKDLIKTLGIQMPDADKLVAADGEKDVQKNKDTIKEIAGVILA